MNKLLRGVFIGLITGAIMFSQTSFATTGWVKGTVTRMLTMNDKFGECMVLLSSKSDSLSCSNWVTFDCTASLSGNTKAAANRKLNAAQLAMVTGNKVRVLVDDSQKINGQCYAPRIDVYAD